MPVLARIIVIRRNGLDGSQFPITGDTCVFGRDSDCDIRIQLPFVSREQCKLMLGKNGYSFHNMSETNVTNINNKPVEESYTLQDKDIITIVDRSFRFEYPENSPFLKNTKISETGSAQTTPFREIQVSKSKSEQNSPFGMLVKDMKKILKNTPKKGQKLIAVDKAEGKAEEKRTLKTMPLPKATPKTGRRSKSVTPKRTPRGRKSVSSIPTMNDNNASTLEPVSDADYSVNNAFATGADKSDCAQKTVATLSQPSVNDTIREISPDVTLTENKKQDNEPCEIAEAEADGKDLHQTKNVSDTSKQSDESEKDFTTSADNQDLISTSTVNESSNFCDNDDGQAKSKAQQKDSTEPVKRRRSSRRSSLLKELRDSVGQPNVEETKASENQVNSEVEDTINISLVLEGCNDESLNADSAVKAKSLRRRSSLSRNLSKKDGHNDAADVSMKSITPEKSSFDAVLTDVPKISLTPSKEADETASPSNEDPYSFPDTTPSDNANTKKWRRRSSGPSSMSKRKALMLFGSPRVQNVTPLRKNMSKLKRKSEPLMEDDEVVSASPMCHKDQENTPTPGLEVMEVENNSSPIKKPRRSIVTSTVQGPAISETSPAISKISRRVSFGPELSPEQFLKMLPPNTPVRKGAAPGVNTRSRKSLAAAGTTNLPTLAEQEQQSKSSPVRTPNTKGYQKVNRTPTPFKPDPNKAKSTSLLQQVLNITMHKKSQIDNDGSPTLPLGKRSSSKVATKEKNQQSCSDETELKEESPQSKELVARKRRSSSNNVQLVNVHKTAVNMYRRRSSRCLSKPLWSDIVKKPAAATNKATKKTISNNEKKKKIAKNQAPDLDANSRHVDSPDTIYIGRTRRRIANTRTPRPSKSAAPVKLDIPMNENYTGLPEMFSTPGPSTLFQDEDDLYDEIKTPKSAGEMLVSPLLNPDTSVDESDVSMTTPVKSINFGSENGASPDFCESTASSAKHLEMSNEDAESMLVEVNFGVKGTPKDNKMTAVQNRFGTKRLMRTPRDQTKSKSVKEHFGTKRIMKTPRDLRKGKSVEENLGTKRLLRTPRDCKKSEPVEENFGTKRMMKTPRALKKSDAVQEHFGTKRLMKTPRVSRKSESVEEHFGTKRLMRTPRDSKKSESVEEHFGTKRLMRTPRDAKTDQVKEHFGTKRLLQTRRSKNKAEPVKEKFGLKRVFHIPKEKAAIENSDDDLHLSNIMASPVSATAEPPTKRQKIDEVVAAITQPSANREIGDSDKQERGSAQKVGKTRKRKTSSGSTKPPSVSVKAIDEDETHTRTSGDQFSDKVFSVSEENQKAVVSLGDASVAKAADPVEIVETKDQTTPVKYSKATRRNQKVTDESVVVLGTATSVNDSMKSKSQKEDTPLVVGRSTRARKNVTFHPSVKPGFDQVREVKPVPTKPQQKKGRKAKKVEVSAVTEKDAAEETKSPGSVPPVTKRGRAKNAQKQDGEPKDVKSKPAAKARSGGTKASQRKDDTPTEDITSSSDGKVEQVSSNAVTRRGRPRAAKATEEPVVVAPTVASSEGPVRQVGGRRQTKLKTTQKKEVDTAEKEDSNEPEKQEKVSPVKAVARKGRSRKVLQENDRTPTVDTAKTEDSNEPKKLEKVAPVKTVTKKGRSRKVQQETDQAPTATLKSTEESVVVAPTVASSEGPVRQVRGRRQTKLKTTQKKEVDTAKKGDANGPEKHEKVAPVKAVTRKGRSKKVQQENDQTPTEPVKATEEAVVVSPTVVSSEGPVRQVGGRRQTKSKTTQKKEVETAEKEDSNEPEKQEKVSPAKAVTRKGKSRKVQQENDQTPTEPVKVTKESAVVSLAVASSEGPVRQVRGRRQTKSKTTQKKEVDTAEKKDPIVPEKQEKVAPVKAVTRKGRSKKVQQENDKTPTVVRRSSRKCN